MVALIDVIISVPHNILDLEQMDRILPDFVYAFILTRSRFGLLHIIFLTFAAELWPLIDIRIWFPLNILIRNGRNLTSFCVYIDIDKNIKVEIGMHNFFAN